MLVNRQFQIKIGKLQKIKAQFGPQYSFTDILHSYCVTKQGTQYKVCKENYDDTLSS